MKVVEPLGRETLIPAVLPGSSGVLLNVQGGADVRLGSGDRLYLELEWLFGKLEKEVFTRNATFYSIQELDKLFAAVNYVFQQCIFLLKNLVAA